ncbi:MAG TPA: hypothetical protein VIV11_37325 [Kofleriaceae bacterium]
MTKYDLFRRRIAPIAFGLAIAFIAYDTCDKHERTSATFVIDYGSAEPDVRVIEAEVWMNGEQVSQFRRAALEGMPIGKTQFKASLPDTDGELRIDVELASGEHRVTKRAIRVSEGANVTIQLERDLR